jgi:hypothetical protein
MNTSDLEDLPILRASLGDLAERTAPPSAVDVHAARREGRRAKVRRSTGGFGAVAAVATVGALCFTVVPSALHPPRTGPGTTPGASASAPPIRPAYQPLALVPGQDPYFLSADFGWLPTGYAAQNSMWFMESSGNLNAYGPKVPLTGASSAFSFDPVITVDIARTPPGTDSYGFSGLAASSTVDVDGQSATIQTGPAKSGGFEGRPGPLTQAEKNPIDYTSLLGLLSWRTTGGYYVQLSASLPPGTPNAAATIAHVAQTLKVTDAPIPMPFYLRNLPASVGSVMESGPISPPRDNTWTFNLSLGLSYSDLFYVSVTPQSMPYTPNLPDSGQATACKEQNGLRICVLANGGNNTLPAQLAKLGVKGVLNDIVGVSANPAHWTTDVVR